MGEREVSLDPGERYSHLLVEIRLSASPRKTIDLQMAEIISHTENGRFAEWT